MSLPPAPPDPERWAARPTRCQSIVADRRRRRTCGAPPTLWVVGAGGVVISAWCADHEHRAIRRFFRWEDRDVLLFDEYGLCRSTDEELAVWAIANGPETHVRPYA